MNYIFCIKIFYLADTNYMKNKLLLKITSLLLLIVVLGGLIIPVIIKASAEIHTSIYLQSKKPVMLVLGDSIASGYGIEKEDNFAEIIGYIHDLEVINKGLDGQKTEDLIYNLEMDYDLIADVNNADLIILSIGGNDLLFSDDLPVMLVDLILGEDELVDEYLWQISNNIEYIISTINEINPRCEIIVLNSYVPNFNKLDNFKIKDLEISTSFFYPLAEKLVNKYNTYFEKINTNLENHFYTADIYSKFNGEENFNKDMIHPSKQGHEVIANSINDILETLTEANLNIVGSKNYQWRPKYYLDSLINNQDNMNNYNNNSAEYKHNDKQSLMSKIISFFKG